MKRNAFLSREAKTSVLIIILISTCMYFWPYFIFGPAASVLAAGIEDYFIQTVDRCLRIVTLNILELLRKLYMIHKSNYRFLKESEFGYIRCIYLYIYYCFIIHVNITTYFWGSRIQRLGHC